MNEFDQEQTLADTGAPPRHGFIALSWLLAGLALSYARLASPAFGLQGDVPLHYHLARSFARSLAEGEWLPRWAGLLDGGRGDAAFTFYPPLYYWLSGGLAAVLGLDALTALKCVSFFGLVLAGATAYLLAREFADRGYEGMIGKTGVALSPSTWSALAGLLYIALPSYLLLSLHRGFLPNAFALSLLPLAMLGAHRVLTGKQRASALALFALSFSAIILTHVITAYLCGLTVGLMTLCYLPRAGWRGIARLSGGTLLALALTAFFWGPQLTEMKWVQIGLQVLQQDYHHYFLFAPAADASRFRRGWADINFWGSLIILTQSALVLALGVPCLRKSSQARRAPLVWFSLTLALAGLVISLPASDIIWRYLPGLKFIQFPWRFQPFVALGAVMLAASSPGAWAWMGRRLKMLYSAIFTWIVITNLVLTLMLAIPQGQEASRAEVASWLNKYDAPSFAPNEANKLRDDDFGFLPYTSDQIFFRPLGAELTFYPPVNQVGGLSIIAGRGRVVTQQLRIARREFRFENAEPVRARIETYHYPNWVARLDGRVTPISAEPGSGLMLVDLPAGTHTLNLDFETVNPWARRAQVVSLIAWLLLFGWALWKMVSSSFFRSRNETIAS